MFWLTHKVGLQAAAFTGFFLRISTLRSPCSRSRPTETNANRKIDAVYMAVCGKHNTCGDLTGLCIWRR